jgi:hypothetical protein
MGFHFRRLRAISMTPHDAGCNAAEMPRGETGRGWQAGLSRNLKREAAIRRINNDEARFHWRLWE